MAHEHGAKMRLRPAGGRAKRKGMPVYGPLDTGCPAVEQAIAALYNGQSEENFWTLMNALNYALEIDTNVLVPLQTTPGPDGAAVPWAEHPIPAAKAKNLTLWLLRTTRERKYLPVFTSLRAAEEDGGTAARPMAEMRLQDAMERALHDKEIDGIVLDPWSNSATLDCALLNGLLAAQHDEDEPGEKELLEGIKAAQAEDWGGAFAAFTDAARKGNAEAMVMLGELYANGQGTRRSITTARELWRTAEREGSARAMLCLGDDCISTGKGRATALIYYREALAISQRTPDFAYTPQVCLRIAQHETQYVSREQARMQLAEARQGIEVQAREGSVDADYWRSEADALAAALTENEK